MPYGWYGTHIDDPVPIRSRVGRPDRGNRGKVKTARKAARRRR